jgi:hypothetical protein
MKSTTTSREAHHRKWGWRAAVAGSSTRGNVVVWTALVDWVAQPKRLGEKNLLLGAICHLSATIILLGNHRASGRPGYMPAVDPFVLLDYPCRTR